MLIRATCSKKSTVQVLCIMYCVYKLRLNAFWGIYIISKKVFVKNCSAPPPNNERLCCFKTLKFCASWTYGEEGERQSTNLNLIKSCMTDVCCAVMHAIKLRLLFLITLHPHPSMILFFSRSFPFITNEDKIRRNESGEPGNELFGGVGARQIMNKYIGS